LQFLSKDDDVTRRYSRMNQGQNWDGGVAGHREYSVKWCHRSHYFQN
jgi:hypothetical protein